LVVRKSDTRDGRAQTLALTAKGRKLVPTLAALADANDAELLVNGVNNLPIFQHNL